MMKEPTRGALIKVANSLRDNPVKRGAAVHKVEVNIMIQHSNFYHRKRRGNE
ncbi:hypothetical protein HanPSC8_Chr04g0161461 [Helianthus annuus]|nr:hypothetical protein HanPSC8_Chr04g0161461 [Helianthus annuus]